METKIQIVRPADERYVKLVGRYKVLQRGSICFDWAGFSIEFYIKVECSSVRILLDFDGGANLFNILCDNEIIKVWYPGYFRKVYVLDLDFNNDDKCRNLKNSTQHKITIVKRNEPESPVPAQQPCTCYLLQIQDRKAFFVRKPEKDNIRRIEFIGDSDTSAFCNESDFIPSSLTAMLRFPEEFPKRQNIGNGYPAILARMFDSEVHVIAWSGIGVYQCGLGTSSTTMLDRYNRTVASYDQDEDNTYGFDWSPDAVVIFIGGNDICGPFEMDKKKFIGSYCKLLQNVKDQRPNAPIICVAPDPSSCTVSREAADETSRIYDEYVRDSVLEFSTVYPNYPVYYFLLKPDLTFPDDYSYLEHWNGNGHLKVANSLADILSFILDWKPIFEPTLLPYLEPSYLKYVETKDPIDRIMDALLTPVVGTV